MLQIAIPNDIRIRSLAWHSVNGWLAVGGESGLLRVLKLELQNQGDRENWRNFVFRPLKLLSKNSHVLIIGSPWRCHNCPVADKDSKIKGLAAPSSLSMNQTLDAHNGVL